MTSKRKDFVKTFAAFLLFIASGSGLYSLANAVAGDIEFRPPNTDPVLFSHEVHTKAKGIRCGACHFRMFEKVGGSYQMKKEKLIKRDFCLYCHNGMKGFDAQDPKNCGRCHKRK